MDRLDKSQRKAKRNAWRQSEHRKAQAAYPLPDARLETFFGLLEALRSEHGCFHDIRHALAVSGQLGLSEAETDALLDWCNAHGGYCDCEIAANTFMHWHETRART
ncbi:MAG: DUF2695 domain-containing protein [Rhodanobacteraceae bacterium]|nr:DUF2695 domain-containing protein [Rhodanobacteraceae bacterium]